MLPDTPTLNCRSSIIKQITNFALLFRRSTNLCLLPRWRWMKCFLFAEICFHLFSYQVLYVKTYLVPYFPQLFNKRFFLRFIYFFGPHLKTNWCGMLDKYTTPPPYFQFLASREFSVSSYSICNLQRRLSSIPSQLPRYPTSLLISSAIFPKVLGLIPIEKCLWKYPFPTLFKSVRIILALLMSAKFANSPVFWFRYFK